MIRLHQFAPAFGLPNASPFCMKLETYLRMAGLPYETVNDGNVLKAPKGKLPWIDDDGTRVADSSFIIEHLSAGTATHSTPVCRRACAPRRRPSSACSRKTSTGPSSTRAGPTHRAGARRGRPSSAPCRRRCAGSSRGWRGAVCWPRCAARAWAGTSRPRSMPSAAATSRRWPTSWRPRLHARRCTEFSRRHAYAFLANLLWAPVDTPIRRHAAARPTLEAYCQRMKARYWA